MNNSEEQKTQYGIIYELMTLEIAHFIKNKRIKDGTSNHTWGAVAGEVDKEYRDHFPLTVSSPIIDSFGRRHIGGVQGQLLCSAAMHFLGEKVEDGWNV